MNDEGVPHVPVTHARQLPRVSCIMPTYNRRALVPLAIEYFLRQDYTASELVVIDTGSDAVGDLVPDVPRIRYLRLGKRCTIGAARNLACEIAQGELILHWDDDDWHAAHRIRYQVEALLQAEADVVGVNPALFYDCRDGSAWRYSYPAARRFWVHGSSLCYRRTFWARARFEDVDVGEDTRFIWSSPGSRMHALPDSTCHISIIHGGNISAGGRRGAYWKRADVSTLRRILGPDWRLYSGRRCMGAAPSRTVGEQ